MNVQMKKIFTYLEENLEEILMVILLGGISLVIFAQVIARLFDKGFPWAEEFCRYCFVYTGMISAGYCIRKGVGIRVDALYSFFPKAVQLVIDYAGKILLTAGGLGVIIPPSIPTTSWWASMTPCGTTGSITPSACSRPACPVRWWWRPGWDTASAWWTTP